MASFSGLVYLFSRASDHFTRALSDTALGNSSQFPIYIKLLSLTSLFSLVYFIATLFDLIASRTNSILYSRKHPVVVTFEHLVLITLTLFMWQALYTWSEHFILRGLEYYEVSFPIAGTGSMYPTFPKGTSRTLKDLAQETVGFADVIPYPNGITIFEKRYLGHLLERGDIVLFDNEKTREITKKLYDDESGFIKRVIAMPRDVFEIRGGLVKINGVTIDEPYIAKARSTFGGAFIQECKELVVPQNKLIVMGDNRKGSGDSRHDLGFVDIQDVRFVIPLSKQKRVLDKNWRNTIFDTEDYSKSRLNKSQFISLVNDIRVKGGLSPLTTQPKLDSSAALRGKAMLHYNDFSFEATRSGYTMGRAMSDSGYSNIVWGETYVLGYYEAEELAESLQEIPSWKEFILKKDFEEIGISEVEGSIDGCPAQVIVLHFAGYIPPNYSLETIDSWRNLKDSLLSIQSGWQDLKTYEPFYIKYKQDVDRINEIIALRIKRAEQIIKRMEANQWLNEEEKSFSEEDATLAEEQINLSTRLNLAE